MPRLWQVESIDIYLLSQRLLSQFYSSTCAQRLLFYLFVEIFIFPKKHIQNLLQTLLTAPSSTPIFSSTKQRWLPLSVGKQPLDLKVHPQYLCNFQKLHADSHCAKCKHEFTSKGHTINSIDASVNIYHCKDFDIPFEEWISSPSGPGFLAVQVHRGRLKKKQTLEAHTLLKHCNAITSCKNRATHQHRNDESLFFCPRHLYRLPLQFLLELPK